MRKVFVLFFWTLSLSVSAVTYYVSSSGNDGWTGISESTPWKTITKVNSVLTSLKPGDRILFKRGDIFHGTLNIACSGIAGNPLIIGAYGSGANPVISGFTTLTSWSSAGNGIYKSPLASTMTINMVAVNGIPRALGRYPNKGYLNFESHVTNTSITDNELGSTPNWTGAELVIRRTRYEMYRCPITNHSGGTISYKTSLFSDVTNGYGYFIQKDIDALDSFGEWYHDGSYLYMFFGTSSPGSYTIKASTSERLAYINNSNYVTIENISFEGANTAAFVVSKYNYLTIQNCKIDCSGKHGIMYTYNAEMSSYLKIDNCSITNSLDSGMRLDGKCLSSRITNNTIRNSGIITGMGDKDGQSLFGGIYCIGAKGRYEYNIIENTGRNGIWFHGDSSLIKNNYISNYCLVLDDAGGIFLCDWQVTYGKQIIGNIVVNGIGSIDGIAGSTTLYAEGIYLDRGTKYVKISGNTTANCGDVGIKLHDANNVVIEDNTSYNNLRQIMFQQSDVKYATQNITMNRNIFFARKPEQLSLLMKSNTDNLTSFGTADYNYYARPLDDDDIIYTYSPSTGSVFRTLQGWQTFTNQDKNSKKSPVVLSDSTDIVLYTNPSKTSKVISLAKPMIDVKGNKYSSSITLLPYTSAVLMEDPAPAIATPPVYKSSLVVNETPNLVELTYDLTLANIVPDVSAFDVRINSNSRSVGKVAISGNKVLLTLSSAIIFNGDVVTVSYTKPAANPLQTIQGGLAASFSNKPVTNQVNPITYSIENTTPALLEILFNLSLIESRIPDLSAFSVKVNSIIRSVKSVSISGNKLKLTLASPVVSGDIVTVSYIKPSENTLRTVTGLDLPSWYDKPVVNKVISESFTILSSIVDNATPNIIVMNYNLTLANIVPDVSAFDVRVNSNSRSLSNVTVSGTKVLLTLSSAMILNGDEVTVSYTKPSVNPLQTTSGTQAASVISRPVINNVNPITCTIENATPSSLEITFNLSLIENRIPDVSSFIVKVNSSGRSIKNIVISGYKVILTLGSPVFYADVVTVSYIKPSDNTLRTITVLEYPTLENMPVVNNVLSQPFTYLGSVVNNETPNVVEMNFNLTLANIVPDVSAFDVRINSNSRSISSVSISGTKVLLTMSSAMILNGDIVTVSYSKPSVNQLQTTLGTQANSLILQPVTNRVDPVMYIIENSNPSLLEITFGLSLENRIPPVSAFTVKVNSVVRSVKYVAVTGYDLLLTLASPVYYGDIVTVSYTKPSTDALKTVTGLEYPSWIDEPVTNNVLYQPLSYLNSVVENATPNIIEMNYNQLLANVIPDVSAFDVRINSNSRTIGKLEISGTRILLSMSSAMISSGDVVTVSYIQPATNPVQTTSGLPASTVTDKPVTNNVYPLAYVIENATPSLLEIIFNLSLADRVPPASAFEVRVNSVIRGVTNVAVSGNEVILTLASPVAYGNVVTVAYTKPSYDAIKTVTGLEYPSFPARTVTNHVGIQPGAKSYQPGNTEEKDKNQQTEGNSGSDKDQSGEAINSESGEFTLYPNPASDFINISIPDGSSDTKTLRIYDLSGKLLFEKDLGSYRNFIEMPARFISGTYFVRILSGNIPLYTKKLVIVR